MDPEAEAVIQANDQFYRALSLADLGAMQRLWLESVDAVCIHPGWRPVYGWEAIRDSWRAIFVNQGPLRIWASEAQARVFGQTAEVTCLENIDTGQVAGAGLIQTRATNIFRRVGAEWKLLEHHAVPAQGGAQPLEPFSHN
jgi:ketosteroid isomerase-like protein